MEQGEACKQLCAVLPFSNFPVLPYCTEGFWKRESAGGVTVTVTFTGPDPLDVSGSKAGCAGTFTMNKSRRPLFPNDGNTTQLPSGSGEVVSSNWNVRAPCHAMSPLVSTLLRFPDASK